MADFCGSSIRAGAGVFWLWHSLNFYARCWTVFATFLGGDYIDINGCHQSHTTYDKVVINNKNKNVTTPKQLGRVPDNNNKEQE